MPPTTPAPRTDITRLNSGQVAAGLRLWADAGPRTAEAGVELLIATGWLHRAGCRHAALWSSRVSAPISRSTAALSRSSARPKL